MTKANEDILMLTREVCAEALRVPIESVQPNTRLIEDLDADSLSLVQLAIATEERFSISVSNEDSLQLKTVAEWATFISECMCH